MGFKEMAWTDPRTPETALRTSHHQLSDKRIDGSVSHWLNRSHMAMGTLVFDFDRLDKTMTTKRDAASAAGEGINERLTTKDTKKTAIDLICLHILKVGGKLLEIHTSAIQNQRNGSTQNETVRP